MKDSSFNIYELIRRRSSADINQRISYQKEMFRKTIHLVAVFVPIFYIYLKNVILTSIVIITILYYISELLRQSGISLPVISRITSIAERERDRGRFVLGPLTLVSGIFCSLLFFPPNIAMVAIYALALGDGIASVIGKLFGRIMIPFCGGKTFIGSIACFSILFVTYLLLNISPLTCIILALTAMFLELLPIKDFDNIIVPLGTGLVALFLI